MRSSSREDAGVDGDNQLLFSCHSNSGASPVRTDGWTSSTCCLGWRKVEVHFDGCQEEREVVFFFYLWEGSKTMPWSVSMCSLLIYVLNSRRKGQGVGFEGVHLRRLRWNLSLSLGSEEDDHGRTGEGGAPVAPSVPVPRPVARGMANRRQVRMRLLAPFTHGALNPCAPHHQVLKVLRIVSLGSDGFRSVAVLQCFICAFNCAALLRRLQQVFSSPCLRRSGCH